MGLRSFLKRHWHKGVWEKVQIIGFVLLIVIIVFESVFFAGIWYNSLQSGLTLYIEPEQPVISTVGEQSYDATFLVGVTNAPFCQEECAYTITDQRTGQHITGTISNPQEALQPITATLTAPDRGLFTSAVQLSLTCTNQPSARCQRSQDSATQTSTVRVEHRRAPAQQEAFEEMHSGWNTTQNTFTNRLSSLLGIIDVDDIRASTTRNQAIQELQLLQEQLQALRVAITNEEFILARTLITTQESAATQEYEALVDTEQRAIRAFQELLGIQDQHLQQLPLITEQSLREQITRYQRAQQQHSAFYQTHPEHALEAFIAARTTPVANTSFAQQAQTLAYQEQTTLCQQNLTVCPQTPINITNTTAALTALQDSCTVFSQLETVYEQANLTRTPHPQEAELCARLERTLPPLAIGLNATLPEQPRVQASVRIPLPQEYCCANGRCVVCGEDLRVPVLFVHGHSFAERTAPEYSLQAFSVMAVTLQEEGWMHLGATFPRQNVVSQSFATSPGGVSFVTTYYYDGFAEEGEVRFVTRKTERIETYAIRLRESIRNVKAITGQDEVYIVAHSMGGLVTRSYLEIFGEEDIAGVVMIGTPNNGIPRLIERICPLIGADFECEDMRTNSLYLRRLAQAPHPTIPVLTIAGTGCDGAFDGVVEVESVALPYARNVIVNGSCPTQEELLHNRMLYPEEYPEVYELVREFLNNPQAAIQE